MAGLRVNWCQPVVENYFNYFTEIEERYQKRRGTGLLLSTLDWALIETWKDAGVPLEAVLAGIDATFDKHDRRPSKTRKINSLAYCSQEVLAAAEDMKEAAAGTRRDPRPASPGLDCDEIIGFLRRNAAAVERIGRTTGPEPEPLPDMVRSVALECASQLLARAEDHAVKAAAGGSPDLEDLERKLTVLEERLVASLTVATPENE